MGQRLYLDHAATTPMLPAAREAWAQGAGMWANPSSPHAEGRAARAALEDARARIKAALGWSGELIFTSGATEALALAIHRTAAGGVLLSAVEHDAVRRIAPDAPVLPVTCEGLVRMAEPGPAGETPLLHVVQQVNSETGVRQPLEDTLAGLVRDRGGWLLADCAQSAGKLDLPDADMIVLSAHKLGGPPGSGALLLRDPAMLRPVGGQEQGYRPGTEDLPAILGFAAALEAREPWLDRAEALRRRLEDGIVGAGGIVVAAGAPRLATIGAYRMPGVPAASQLIRFDMAGIAVSAGSACSSGSLRPSHVLAAMGWSEGDSREVIRVSFGPDTHEADIDRFLREWTALAAGARSRAA